MKNHKFLLGISILLILLSPAAGFGLARETRSESTEVASVLNPKADAPWYTSWADNTTSGGLGAYPSIAYSPLNGLPYISYYDADNGNLMLAHYAPDGSGNCGVSGSWECEGIDGDGLGDHISNDVGRYSSLSIHKNTSGILGWQMGISYYDATDKVLRYAVYDYSFPYGGFWDYVTITPIAGFGSGDGMYTSLKYSSSGSPHIAYYAWRWTITGTIGYLKVATKVSSGGNCGLAPDNGHWQCDSADSGDGVGKYASLDIDYDEQVQIAYYDEGNGNLKYAYFAGIATCLNGWECSTVDGAVADVGAFASLKAKQSATDTLHIAYYDKTHGKVKYATSGWSGGTGNCGPSNGWQCLAVDSMGAGPGMSITGISLDLDTVGEPIIAYQDASVDLAPAKLNIARPATVYEYTSGIGNCGDVPPGNLFEVWQCDTLDNASYGQGMVHVGTYVSVAVSPSGLATIAYFEENDYDVVTALKVAYQRPHTYLPVVFR